MNMGSVEGSRGNFQEALEYFEKALEIYLKSYGGAHEAVADTLFNMSIIYDNIGDESKGLELTRRAHSICVVALGADHPKTKNYARFI